MVPGCALPVTRYHRKYMEDNKHTLRLTLALTALVAVLLVVAVNHFMDSGSTQQQAAVLRAYAR